MANLTNLIIVEQVQSWGRHFGVDTTGIDNDKHPIWQNIVGLLTRLHLENEELRQSAKDVDE
jgi:hypothetical protein